jgi:hypothetical protein
VEETTTLKMEIEVTIRKRNPLRKEVAKNKCPL